MYWHTKHYYALGGIMPVLYFPEGSRVNSSIVTVGPGHMAAQQTLDRNLPGAVFDDVSTMDSRSDFHHKVAGYFKVPEAKLATSFDLSLATDDTGDPYDGITNYPSAFGQSHVIGGVAYSYNGRPTGGRMMIESPSGVRIHDQYIPLAGPGWVDFNPPLRGANSESLTIFLCHGGSATGSITSVMHWLE